MSDVESDISSPEWKPWDDDADDDNNTNQSENNTVDIQQHESEGNKIICSVICHVVSRHRSINTWSNW